MRFVVYTAVFGGADPVMPALSPTPGADFVVLTEGRLRVPDPWNVCDIALPQGISNPKMKNRFCKLHATQLFSEYDVSVYVDTHHQVISDLTPLVTDFLESGFTVGFATHAWSADVDEEIARSVRMGYINQHDYEAVWPLQRLRQREAGFSDDVGVYVGSLILRRHVPDAKRLEDAWWEELSHGVPRDQAALPFALWQTGVTPYKIPIEWSLAPYLQRWPHLPATARYGRLIRWLEARVTLRRSYRWALWMLRPRTAFLAGLRRIHAWRSRS